MNLYLSFADTRIYVNEEDGASAVVSQGVTRETKKDADNRLSLFLGFS